MLSDSEYIFLDNPDNKQDIETVNIIKNAIIYEVKNHNRKVFIISEKREIWLDITTDIISRNENNQYIKTKNKLVNFKFEKPQLQLVKKAS